VNGCVYTELIDSASESRSYCHGCCTHLIVAVTKGPILLVCYRMRVKKQPLILALHLKRFKYVDSLQRYTKLTYRVAFSFELRLFITVSTKVTGAGHLTFRHSHAVFAIFRLRSDTNWQELRCRETLFGTNNVAADLDSSASAAPLADCVVIRCSACKLCRLCGYRRLCICSRKMPPIRSVCMI